MDQIGLVLPHPSAVHSSGSANTEPLKTVSSSSLSFVGRLTWVTKAQPPQEQRYPFLSVWVVPLCVQMTVWCQCLGFLTCGEILMHAIAHWGCTYSFKESALEVDSGRKIPCRTGDSNPRQYCAWLFGRTLYQLNYRYFRPQYKTTARCAV